MSTYSDIVDIDGMVPANGAVAVGGAASIVYPFKITDAEEFFWSLEVTFNGVKYYPWPVGEQGICGFGTVTIGGVKKIRTAWINVHDISGWSPSSSYTHQIKLFTSQENYSADSPYESPEYTFTTDALPTAPTGIYPANGATNIGHTFYCDGQKWRDTASCSVQGDAIWAISFEGGGWTYSYILSPLTPLTTYNWRIKVTRNNWIIYTDITTFTVGDFPPIPTNYVPANGATDVDGVFNAVTNRGAVPFSLSTEAGATWDLECWDTGTEDFIITGPGSIELLSAHEYIWGEYVTYSNHKHYYGCDKTFTTISEFTTSISPSDTATSIDYNKQKIINWNSMNFSSPYNVYFGPTGSEKLVSSEQTETHWHLPTLKYNTEYTWWINNYSHWTFTTIPFYTPNDRVTSKQLVAAAANKIWLEDI